MQGLVRLGSEELVFDNVDLKSKAAVSGPVPKESTNIFLSVLSGLQMYAIALLMVALTAWIFVYAIFFPSAPLLPLSLYCLPGHLN